MNIVLVLFYKARRIIIRLMSLMIIIPRILLFIDDIDE